MKNKKIKGGFTLIELLATLAILSIVVTIGIAFSMNVISKSKDKSYIVTASNIKNAANNYVVENPELVGWQDNKCKGDGNRKCQMQCVTVQDLIDNGYFKEDILGSSVKISDTETKKVELSDSVYIERDDDTKAITNVLFNEDSCSSDGNITISVEPSGWVNTSKKVTITYSLNGNVSGAKYYYQIKEGSSVVKDDDGDFDGNNKKDVVLTLDKNVSITAKINDGDSKTFYISTIDKEKPKLYKDVLDEKVSTLKNNRIMTFGFSDDLSGLNQYYFGKKDPDDESVKYAKLANNKDITIK